MYIECTSQSGDKVLIFVKHIRMVESETLANGVTVTRISFNGQKNSVSVKEPYKEVKKAICIVSNAIEV